MKMRAGSIAALAVIFFINNAFISCNSLTVEKFYKNGIAATSSPIATDVGLEVLRRGGNAFDAAVAVGFALAVCHPEAGNIGGGGFAMIYLAETGEVKSLDFRETAPGLAFLDMYLDSAGNIVPGSSTLGAKACGVPGTVAGLFELWQRHGSLDWLSLVEPAMKLADTGIIVTDYLVYSFLNYKRELSNFPETEKIFLDEGRIVKKGEKFVQKDLAKTLERIARDSCNGFYAGETAELIVRSMQMHGGLITREDLEKYEPVWREPIHFRFDSLDIYSMPPPSSGGVVLGEILMLLEPYDFFKYTPDSPGYIHLFAEACRLAFADRAVHLGDPDFIDNPVGELLDSGYISSRRALIDPDNAGRSDKIGSGLPEKNVIKESESTTHYCIADNEGNIVSLTYTINSPFGSKLVVDGAGFLMNNEMDDFAVKPGVPNIWGLVGGKANEIAPGKRMLSSMNPTIILNKGKPFLALGSPGGSKIITTVAQAIVNFTRFGLNLQDVVRQPRFHHQWLPDTLYMEQGGFGINIIQNLISRGHVVKERTRYSELQIIHIGDNGLYSGASDTRRAGMTGGY